VASYTTERTTDRRWVVLLALLLCFLAAALAVEVFRALGATAAPPKPVILSAGLPGNPTADRSATFHFTDSKSVTFECALDGSLYATCGLGTLGSRTYPGPLAVGSHTFQVRARSATKASSAASYTWLVLGSPTAGSAAGLGASARVKISGRVGGLVPGMTRAIRVVLSNPTHTRIRVTALRVRISRDSVPSGCPSAKNFRLQQSTGISAKTPLIVPARSSVTLTRYPLAPRITFRNLPVNQDNCQGKSFVLSYTGQAHS
jgi:hypothetical protein